MTPEEKLEVDRSGFLNTVFKKHSVQCNFHLTLLLQDYLNTGSNGYSDVDAVELYQNHPKVADRVLDELDIFLLDAKSNRSSSILYRDNLFGDIKNILNALRYSYQESRSHVDLFSKKIKCEKLQKELTHMEEARNSEIQREQEILESKKLQKAAQQQHDLRIRTDIPADIKAKLLQNPPVLAWQINPGYSDGPYRREKHTERTGFAEYQTRVVIPIYIDLLERYPELISYAQNNAEHQPNSATVLAATVAWQQGLLLENRPTGLSEEAVALLTSCPPQLPWELNLDNTSAAGYQCTSNVRGERYITIPLRDELIQLYPELMRQAELNKQPAISRDVVVIGSSPDDIMFLYRRTDRRVFPALARYQETTTTLNQSKYTEIQDFLSSHGINIEDIDQDKGANRMLICPISHCLMVDPVTLGTTGDTFDRESIERALSERPGTNPLTNKTVSDVTLTPNRIARAFILDLLKEHVARQQPHASNRLTGI